MSKRERPWEIFESEFVTSAVNREGYPSEALPQVAFAGRSNCGKSSLLNCLVRRKRLAKTSGRPGLTQLINFFRINSRWHYVDLPGYGFAKAPKAEKDKWQKMVEEYLRQNPNLRLLILLLDIRRKPSLLDDQLVEFLNHHDLPVRIVLTKCDKLKHNARRQARRDIGEHYGLEGEDLPLATSATKPSLGRTDLLRLLYEVLEAKPLSVEIVGE